LRIEIRRPNKANPSLVDRITLNAEVVESTCRTELNQLHLLKAVCQTFIVGSGTSIRITMEKEER